MTHRVSGEKDQILSLQGYGTQATHPRLFLSFCCRLKQHGTAGKTGSWFPDTPEQQPLCSQLLAGGRQPVEGPLPGSKQPASGLCWAGHRQSRVRKVACFSKAATQFPSSAPGYRKQEATRLLCRCLFVASVLHLEGGSQFPKHECREQNVQEMCLPRTPQWQGPEPGLSAFKVPGLMWFFTMECCEIS